MTKKKPKKFLASPITVADGTNRISFSYGSGKCTDNEGNEVEVFLWINGDWKVSYKGKEYIIKMSDTVSDFISWLNRKEE